MHRHPELEFDQLLPLDKIPLPYKETSPPFLQPADWLDRVADDILAEYQKQGTDSIRPHATALVRCSRGGKTRALKEIMYLIRKRRPEISCVYITFNSGTPVDEFDNRCFERTGSYLSALLRRIAFEAWSQRTNKDFSEFEFDVSAVAIKRFLGDSSAVAGIPKTPRPCILFVDELNMVTVDQEFADFLRDRFLTPANRMLVFTSHILSVAKGTDASQPGLMTLFASFSSRPCYIPELPRVETLDQAREMVSSVGKHFEDVSYAQFIFRGRLPGLFVDPGNITALLSGIRNLQVMPENCGGMLSALARSFFDGSYKPSTMGAIQRFADVQESELFHGVRGRTKLVWPLVCFEGLVQSCSSKLMDADLKRLWGHVRQCLQGFSSASPASGKEWEHLFFMILILLVSSWCPTNERLGRFSKHRLPIGGSDFSAPCADPC
jgi:hypothetical protein